MRPAILVWVLGSLPLAAQYTVIDLNPRPGLSVRPAAIEWGQIVGAGGVSNASARAFLWSDPAARSDLNPPGFLFSQALAMGDGQQAGLGVPPPRPGQSVGVHALLWAGVAASATDLHPNGWISSQATCVSGGQQGGFGFTRSGGDSLLRHALLWSGYAASATDLHPAGASESFINGCFGGRQVGGGILAADGNSHAMLWSGSAASARDLHPDGFTNSVANGIGAGQQVGRGSSAAAEGTDHALLWTGDPSNVVDLHPDGYTGSVANATNGQQQVGAAMVDGHSHALLWAGSADTARDLNQFLPPDFTGAAASGIDAGGNIVGVAVDATGVTHGILWSNTAQIHGDPVLASIGVGPTTVYGNNEAQGTINLSDVAPDGGLTNALSPSDPSAVTAPVTVTIPSGQRSAAFIMTPTTGSIASSITITAAYGDTAKSAGLSLAPPADQVRISKVNYTPGRLLAQATSSNSNATLLLYVTSSGELIGDLPNLGGGQYGETVFVVMTDPQNVTVRSSLGGSDSKAVSGFEHP